MPANRINVRIDDTKKDAVVGRAMFRLEMVFLFTVHVKEVAILWQPLTG